jgi:hypothetical protein
MSPFLIFVTVLTIGYVIYYAVIIMQDLYGKKGEPKEDIEEFEVSTMAGEESPIVVNEDGTNFKVGNDEDNESEQRIVVYDESNFPLDNDATPQPTETPEEECERYQAAMEDINVESSGETEPDMMIEMLLNQKPGGPKIFCTRHKV